MTEADMVRARALAFAAAGYLDVADDLEGVPSHDVVRVNAKCLDAMDQQLASLTKMLDDALTELRRQST